MANEGKKNIVIIGGGIIGSTTAYFLTRHPSFNPTLHTITLLEATAIASGASGKAGGLLALWAYPKSIVPLSFRLHAELAKEHGGEDRWGYRRVHVGQIECKGRPLVEREKGGSNGGAGAGAGEKNGNGDARVSLQKRSKEAVGLLRAAGVPAELDWVDPESITGYDAMGDLSTTAQVHPYYFTTSMANLAEEKGAKVILGARVTKINQKGDEVESVTYHDKNTDEDVTIPATDVIVSAGPWTNKVLPSAPISALRAHSVTIKPTRDVSAYALFTEIRLPSNFGSTKNESVRKKKTYEQIVTPEIYARPKQEVYACGEGDRLVPLPVTSDLVEVDEERCQDIIDYVGSISDELRDGEVTAKQACYLPNVSGGGPLVGLTGTKGLLLASGHTCWGIQNGPGTGKLISEFVFDGRAKSANIGSLDPRKWLD